jgi:hypothetical protein
MNVSGIRPISGFYKVHSTSQVSNPEAISDLATQAAEADINTSVDNSGSRSRQTFKASDMAQQYDSRQTYNMKGSNSDLSTLDVEKAISDMQKDSALQQYQYFVGNAVASEGANNNNNNSENTQRQLENFEF